MSRLSLLTLIDFLRPVRKNRLIPAIMHLFHHENKLNREIPANMHPFETFFRFQDEKACKACIIAGFLMFSRDLIENACTYAGISKSVSHGENRELLRSRISPLWEPILWNAKKELSGTSRLAPFNMPFSKD
ncbi:hypothetical protein [Paenibacillus alba]|uniref:Uncharacterized protein n=1 Tax=Paenibacillus alba TaxID=1197127 RepID=A0ABU6G4L0_9BACL|nr:hypothetical protein [Paenibacillus alba]MEC0229114.1 hypothetical protein [Paenibacillus alba]